MILNTRWLLDQIRGVLAWHDLLFLDDPYDRWYVYFLGLIEPLKEEQLLELIRRLNMPAKFSETLLWAKGAADHTLFRLYRQENASPKEIYYLLNELSTEFLLYMMAKTRQESTKRAISLYFTQLKNTRPLLAGKDLLELGYEPGPRYKLMLQTPAGRPFRRPGPDQRRRNCLSAPTLRQADSGQRRQGIVMDHNDCQKFWPLFCLLDRQETRELKDAAENCQARLEPTGPSSHRRSSFYCQG